MADQSELHDNLSNELHTKLFEHINSISSLFKLNYPLNPTCQYLYPSINQIILQNIVNALVSNKKFYYQTLHLMNKMCLPCPFIPNTFTLNSDVPFEVNIKFNKNKNIDFINEEPMNVDSTTSESEIELSDDEETRINKNVVLSKIKKIKVKSFIPSENTKFEKVNVEEIFEKNDDQKIKHKKKITVDLVNIQNELKIVNTTDSGFGKILATTKSSNEEMSKEDLIITKNENETSEFITKEELKNNRLTVDQLKELSAYKNYDKGELSTRLYIKNVSKKADEVSLRRIYGRYVDFNNETHKNSFDIRLMKEGRMKGQAFVTLPSEDIAKIALDETNGYMLFDKPIVVQFARSAKTK